MSQYEVSKTVEAVKLNKRTGAPLGEPAISLPYGAIIEKLEEVGEYYAFTYMSERYRMRKDNVRGAVHALVAPAVVTASVKAVPEAPSKPVLVFERLGGTASLSRAKIPGGWLVMSASSVTFVPDEKHEWDGGSVD